jgi:hypothetical protein
MERLERGLHEYKLTAEENEKKYSEVNIKTNISIYFSMNILYPKFFHK